MTEISEQLSKVDQSDYNKKASISNYISTMFKL